MGERSEVWRKARAALDGLPNGRGLNIAYEAVDRHVVRGKGDRVAFRFVAEDGSTTELTYLDLARLSNRFANVLRVLGVCSGERVFALTGRIPELYIAALGALKARAVFCALFPAFGPDPVRVRLVKGRARILVTTDRLFQRKVKPVRDQLADLAHVITVGGESPGTLRVRLRIHTKGRFVLFSRKESSHHITQNGRSLRLGASHPLTPVLGNRDQTAILKRSLSFHKLTQDASDQFDIPATDPEDTALLHFTSGTTGSPKGALHVHEAVVAHHATVRYALDLTPPGTSTGVRPTRGG